MTNPTHALNLINHTHSMYVPTENDFISWYHQAHVHLDNNTDRNLLELNIAIISEKESQQLNFQYRNQNKATNVLSFPYHPFPGETLPVLGDLAMCAKVINREAEQQNLPPVQHWAHITVHGILHLFGYDHNDEKSAHEMEALEISILKKLGYPNPYQQSE